MPTYEYKCSACSHTFEQFQSMKDPALRKCPSCGKAGLERLIGTGAAVIFKGSGFYQTDYRSESYKKAAEADKPAATPSDSSSPANSKPEPARSDPPKSEPAKPAADSGSKSGSRKKARKQS